MAHLTESKRNQLEALKKAGHTQEFIADIMGCDQSTISRELQRNSSPKTSLHRANRAQERSDEKRKESYEKRDCWYDDKNLLAHVLEELEDGKSPDQIAGRMKQQKRKKTVSFQTIYSYVEKDKQQGGKLYKFLRYQGTKYKWRGFGGDDRGKIPNRKGIEERPEIVDKKERVGDWESDLVVSCRKGKGAVATFVERACMYLRSILVVDQSAEEMVRASHKVFDVLPEGCRHTMTHDNGKEISKHEQITEEIGIEVYCARPYRSCDRGLNEFMNREMRRFFPKGTDFSRVTQKEIDRAVDWLNNCPRRSLYYRTPNEVFQDHLKFMHLTL
ncbi:IS30 family transposase [Candidatus Gracilibacteria bacterium]|nr:IS30 family transposase [Candidatus Gracilibacteria bacterium]